MEWSQFVDAAGKHVRAAVMRKISMFADFPDLGPEDITSEVLTAIWPEYPRFNPTKASFSTWIGMIARRRIIDIWRKRGRQAKRDRGYARSRRENYTSDVHYIEQTDGSGNVERIPLLEWLEAAYNRARFAVKVKRYRRGPAFDVAQAVTCAMLMERVGLSTRAACLLFLDREDLRRAVHFERIPSQMWFVRARKFLRHYTGGRTVSQFREKSVPGA